MSLIAELFRHSVAHPSQEASSNLAKAHCPHLRDTCDGGGNRDMARLTLRDDPGLRARFDAPVLKAGTVSCGICSVGPVKNPWIVCPRRLFSITSAGICPGNPHLQDMISRLMKGSCGKELRVSSMGREGDVRFNYSFDYVLRESVEDGKYGPPTIIEVMACSTSGGNKSEGTDVATAFRKAVLASPDQRAGIAAPGVNVRQVWARMASQMIPKAEAAIAWGGTTIWVIQDKLAAYIKQTTGLRLEDLRSDQLGEVNIISTPSDPSGEPVLYAGPISAGQSGEPCFLDILRPSMIPELAKFDSLCAKAPNFTLIL
jgi:hypothetical protein